MSAEAQPELDRTVYTLAKDLLLKSGVDGVTPELVEKYLHLDKTTRPRTLAGLYQRVLESAQNANMKAGVIGGSIGGVYKLGPVLCGFDPARVLVEIPLWVGRSARRHRSPAPTQGQRS